jgi:TolB-like protein/Tfp pilus assembly protein PilF
MIGATVSHYKIVEKLGSGGMGVVYKAEDTRLKRTVALKFLPPRLTCDLDAKERFIHEAQAASGLQHSNICTIHDIDETEDGQLFIVMDCYEGESLNEKLAHGPMRLEETVNVAVQVVNGLSKAHGKGIVHRDIKPANIFITTDGTVKILDFGLAKLAGGQTRLTKAGSTLGTAAYMSPEQARGEEVDGRTDIWSLGVVMYEMLTGQLPFKSEYEQALVYSILNEEPTEIEKLRPDVPPGIREIVKKALAKVPGERYERVEELAAGLRSVSEAHMLAASGDGVGRREPSIAVLPFANLSADKENEYFSDGLAEDIIDALTQVPGLRVMARTSSFAFRGKEADVREIGARLNVEHILEGSVRRMGNRLRVTAQLVKVSDGYHLWSQRFDRELTDVFAIQDEISQAIVEKLQVRLAGDRPLVKRHTEDLAAYDLCLKARYHLSKLTREGLEAGRQYCEQAIALDQNYALAYAVLADSYIWSAYWGFASPREVLPRAKAAALEALRLDDTIADAHYALGAVLCIGEFAWHDAEGEFHRALQLNPLSAALFYYAQWFLYPMGRVEEGVTEVRRAIELDPLDPLYNSLYGYVLHSVGRFDEAVAQLQHAIDLDPTFFFPYWFLSITHALNGRLGDAIAAAEKANELSGGNASTLGQLGRVYALAGRTAEAQQLLVELEARSRLGYVPPSSIAMILRGLGDLEKGLEWWARGVEEHDLVLLSSLRTEPSYGPLRSHPAYKALLRKMNLEP